jgi:hypothetical protein
MKQAELQSSTPCDEPFARRLWGWELLLNFASLSLE